MSHIVQLAHGTLAGHAGNYSAWREQHDRQAAAAEAALAHARHERDAGLRALRQQHDAQQQRNARHARQARDTNPMMPSRNSSTHNTKIAPWTISTQDPSGASSAISTTSPLACQCTSVSEATPNTSTFSPPANPATEADSVNAISL
ncbi:hypothetical protein G6F62_014066 [Rhizopus arrhizus]|nr:hypothetical protein G6F62_014066 [Rhizopus arrhizus]